MKNVLKINFLIEKGVVLFLRMEDARGLLLAAKRAGKVGQFTFLASDGWGKEGERELFNLLMFKKSIFEKLLKNFFKQISK